MTNPFRRRSAIGPLAAARSSGPSCCCWRWAFVVLFPIYWLVVTSFKTPYAGGQGPVLHPVRGLPADARRVALHPGRARQRHAPAVRQHGDRGPVERRHRPDPGFRAAYALVRFTYRPKVGDDRAVHPAACAIAFVGIAPRRPAAARVCAPPLAVFAILAQTIGRRFTLGPGQQRHRVLADLAADPAADRRRRSRCTCCSSRSACSTASPPSSSRTSRPTCPIVVWLMRDYFASLPRELEESAAVDGASIYRIVRSIVLPDLRARAGGHVPDRADLRLERVPHRARPDQRERPDDAAPGGRPERDPRAAVVGDVGADPDHDRPGRDHGDPARALSSRAASSSARSRDRGRR